MYPVYIDIETIPTSRRDVRDYIAASIKPPGTLKKPESIRVWMDNDKEQAIDDAVAKTGLDGAFGQIVCIGIDAHDDGNPVVFSSLEERDLLTRFNGFLSDQIRPADLMATTVVGHNVASFDLRFLLQRYIVNSIKPHLLIARSAGAKPWESDKVYDTMIQFAGVGNRISLDKLCLALSIQSPKGEIDGSKVAEYVAAGALDQVAEYCGRDVDAVRSVHRRMVFA